MDICSNRKGLSILNNSKEGSLLLWAEVKLWSGAEYFEEFKEWHYLKASQRRH